MRTNLCSLFSSTLLAVVCMASAAAADIVHVGSNGVDNSTCGDPAQPCRSITRAVQHAQPGDTILVGPGLYGDINRDRDFLDPGDEAADPTGRFCVVCIFKRVRILSTDGADATRIESLTTLFNNMDAELQALILIAADGVTFGTPGHGFEIAGLPFSLLTVAGRSNVSVGGNVARRSEPHDRDLELPTEYGMLVVAAGGTTALTGNTAIDNHFGIVVLGTGFTVLRNNSAVNNSWGGISADTTGGVHVLGNFASGNGGGRPVSDRGQPIVPLSTGFDIGTQARVEDNVSIANYGPGFRFTNGSTSAGTLQVRHNAATANDGAGIVIAGGKVDVRINNIFGNLGAGSGCGLINESGRTIDATKNFWGAATGPGVDPADKAGPGSGCDHGPGSVTQVAPFATESVSVFPARAR
jgi:parallel beta-helix repeat protein